MKNMNTKFWGDIDFSLNRAFWTHWGDEAALPFRVDNLRQLQDFARSVGFDLPLYGRSLRDATRFSYLGPDHDDDLVCQKAELTKERRAAFLEHANRAGFSLIRDDGDFFSLERDGRYCDIHVKMTGFFTEIDAVRLHGFLFSIPSNSEEMLVEKYGPAKALAVPNGQSAASTWSAFVAFMRVGFRSRSLTEIRESIGYVLSGLARIVASSPRGKKPGFSVDSRSLTLEEFLELKIDEPGAVNWRWRGPQMDVLYRAGETLADALPRIENADARGFQQGVSETDTSECFPEPMSLARSFWQGGENLFLYPAVFGFRHNVMPYHGANLYILSKKRPLLYSAAYYDSLPRMTETEIELFLEEHPIEVKGGCVISGRHRVSAMLGRVSRGENYIPLHARFEGE